MLYAMQASQSWSSQPIDVEYRYLPEEAPNDQNNQQATSNSSQGYATPAAASSDMFSTYDQPRTHDQPSTSYASTEPYSSRRQRVTLDRNSASRQPASFDRNAMSRQRVSFDRDSFASGQSDRATFADGPGDTRSRRRVSIKPTNRRRMQNGRIVRQAAPGQVGVNVVPDGPVTPELNSNLVRALLGLFPFLRSWGGFL